MKVRTRFAPSPTGSLHIGGIRSALYPYALARRHGGDFILRIEDTDQNRKVEGSEQEIQDVMTAYGLEWDEMYRQSERLDIYKEYAEKLIESGHAYYSFETKEELEEARSLAEANNQIFKFRSPNRDMPLDEARKRIESGEQYVIRLKTPESEELDFEDAVQGKMRFNTADIDDTILLKSDGFPTYHLAVVVDDKLMEITHVLRGFGWIPSIPKHILIHRAFGWDMPVYGHLTDILNPDGKGKLSKRSGAVAAQSFLNEGYLPEAVLNFLMLLGWSSPEERVHGETERELFTLEDFVEIFDLKDLNKSNQIFDRQKLQWFNKQYIHVLSDDALENRFLNWFKENSDDAQLKEMIVEKGPDYLQEILKLSKQRLTLLSDVPEQIIGFYRRPDKLAFSEVKQLKKIDEKELHLVLSDFLIYLEDQDEDLANWDHDQWEHQVREIADAYELKHGVAFMALRTAITRAIASPPLYETIEILGKKETTERIKEYLS